MENDFKIGFDNKALYSPLGDIFATYRKPEPYEAIKRYIYITIYDANTKKKLITCDGDAGHVFCICFSPGGTLIATVSLYGIKIWTVETGKLYKQYKNETAFRIGMIAFSSDGTLAQYGDSGEQCTIRICDIYNDKIIQKVEFNEIENVYLVSFAFNPEGTSILLGYSDGLVRFFNVESVTFGENIDLKRKLTFADFISEGKFAFGLKDESLYALSSNRSRIARVYNINNNEYQLFVCIVSNTENDAEIYKFSSAAEITSIAFTPNDEDVMYVSDNTIKFGSEYYKMYGYTEDKDGPEPFTLEPLISNQVVLILPNTDSKGKPLSPYIFDKKSFDDYHHASLARGEELKNPNTRKPMEYSDLTEYKIKMYKDEAQENAEAEEYKKTKIKAIEAAAKEKAIIDGENAKAIIYEENAKVIAGKDTNASVDKLKPTGFLKTCVGAFCSLLPGNRSKVSPEKGGRNRTRKYNNKNKTKKLTKTKTKKRNKPKPKLKIPIM